MKYLHFFFLVFLIFARAASSVAADNATIIVFSRHTFRGISKNIGPQTVSLPEYGISLALPNLSYEQDATPKGLFIAEHFASLGLNQAATLAVEALSEKKSFDGHWDEIRADLSTERTFWTALYLRKGLVKEGSGDRINIPVTGCKTKEGAAIDLVSVNHSVKNCVPEALSLKLREASPDLPKLQKTFQDFLNLLRSTLGLTHPVMIPAAVYSKEGSLPKVYEEIATLASALEMSAELGPPLPQLFPNASPTMLSHFGKRTLNAGVNALGMRFFISAPAPLSDAMSVFPIDYVASRPRGSHTIVVSHDDFLSALVRSLGLISSEGEPDSWAVYPIESYIFAFGRDNVSVVRMRIQTKDPDGSIPGNYASQVLWKGSLGQWNEKVNALKKRARGLDLGAEGNACLQALKPCVAETLEVAF